APARGLCRDSEGARPEHVKYDLHGLGRTLAELALVVAAKLHGLMRTGGRSGRHGGTAERAVVQKHLHLDGGVASRIEDLPGSDLLDKRHLYSLGKTWVTASWAGTTLRRRYRQPLFHVAPARASRLRRPQCVPRRPRGPSRPMRPPPLGVESIRAAPTPGVESIRAAFPQENR